MKKYRNIVVFSGGIDSTVVASLLSGDAENTLLAHVDQGFKVHEQICKDIADALGMDMVVMDHKNAIDSLRIPGMRYIPGYRAFNLLTAITLADKHDAPFIYTGEISNPYYVNETDPDYLLFKEWLGAGDYSGEGKKVTRDEFARWYGESMYGKPEHFQFVDPIWGFSKAAVIRLGVKLGVKLENTITCRSEDLDKQYGNSAIKHCGRCMPCISRRVGFVLAGVVDPTSYIEKPDLPKNFFEKK